MRLRVNGRTFDRRIVRKFDEVLSRGLCSGIGKQGGQVCIEAALCEVLGLPHGDDPKCVTAEVRSYKITLNDCKWTSPQARAAGLRDLGIAQLGSEGVVDGREFLRRLQEKTIRVLIPALFREVFARNEKLLKAADRCEKEGTAESVREANDAAGAAAYAAFATDAADAAYAAADAARAADAAADAAGAAAGAAAYAAAYAVGAARAARKTGTPRTDKYLLLSAGLALEVLRELKSPGCEWLKKEV